MDIPKPSLFFHYYFCNSEAYWSDWQSEWTLDFIALLEMRKVREGATPQPSFMLAGQMQPTSAIPCNDFLLHQGWGFFLFLFLLLRGVFSSVNVSEILFPVWIPQPATSCLSRMYCLHEALCDISQSSANICKIHVRASSVTLHAHI